MEQRFRENYDGEFIILKTIWKDGRKVQEREFIPNPITNQHISGRAAVIGNDKTGRQDVIKALENHRGGLLGSKRLQLYGCEGIWKELRLHFCVETDPTALQEIIDRKYTEDTVVYSSVPNCTRFPGNFYIIPYSPKLVPCAAAAYLAAFDGHKEIFILDVDGINPTTQRDSRSVTDLGYVFDVYNTVNFYLITDAVAPPDALRNHKNVRLQNYAWFINYCDV